MYAPDAMQGSEMQAQAHEPERRQMDQAEARYGFRPLALPALAAAAHSVKPAGKVAPRTNRKGVLGIVHEDAPID
ncbi:hypothetical protein MKK70_20260 [Methylobacterium sp. E-041]|jgi:hypothetical protein|uniref:hypothetical protein n=1 Tax=unclassified Methylobacterium TaxID=2615210 RepID=UPI0011CCC241|nr:MULTISPECIES: hypothetical protein [unclassified Methylobacterium]RZK82911.1 MAG: hypothetical protein EOO66_25615 [Methylobacterium sp.]MCJ2007586.1 hypothetical protein [Methylobacterium sp. J-092]MCJ2041258.1 hypothetical protein [Methylobacterium sp. J-059]MCJ2077040.1 hypothetical protein [Methylobacterium sp. E-016]MCJ2107668.1 hypothetical protein [Methylobacterium sp. E-041]